MDIEVRQLPKKTVAYIGILIFLGFVWFFLVASGKSTKVAKILYTLGYKNISDVQVYGKQEFIRDDINLKGYKYTIRFKNLTTNEECNGFVLKDFKNNVEKDLNCKKIKLEYK